MMKEEKMNNFLNQEPFHDSRFERTKWKKWNWVLQLEKSDLVPNAESLRMHLIFLVLEKKEKGKKETPLITKLISTGSWKVWKSLFQLESKDSLSVSCLLKVFSQVSPSHRLLIRRRGIIELRKRKDIFYSFLHLFHASIISLLKKYTNTKNKRKCICCWALAIFSWRNQNLFPVF